jgi:hypothetical protein
VGVRKKFYERIYNYHGIKKYERASVDPKYTG